MKIIGLPNTTNVWGAEVFGMVTVLVIGKVTEYFTSEAYMPTKSIAENAVTGPATVIITGFGTGMMLTLIPVISIQIGSTLSFYCPSGFNFWKTLKGLYGKGISTVGMP